MSPSIRGQFSYWKTHICDPRYDWITSPSLMTICKQVIPYHRKLPSSLLGHIPVACVNMVTSHFHIIVSVPAASPIIDADTSPSLTAIWKPGVTVCGVPAFHFSLLYSLCVCNGQLFIYATINERVDIQLMTYFYSLLLVI